MQLYFLKVGFIQSLAMRQPIEYVFSSKKRILFLFLGGRNWLSYHFYDRNNEGLPWVNIRKLIWEAGWPKVTNVKFDFTSYFDEQTR